MVSASKAARNTRSHAPTRRTSSPLRSSESEPESSSRLATVMVQPEPLKATVIHTRRKLITNEPEELMKTKKFAVTAVLIYALISLLGTTRQIQAQSNQTAYAKMAPLDQY